MDYILLKLVIYHLQGFANTNVAIKQTEDA
jgi:hypothetical protein